MEDLEFSLDAIERLAAALSTVELDADQRDLLLAIFAAAADQATPAGEGRATLRAAQIRSEPQDDGEPQAAGAGDEETSDSLRAALLGAYAPHDDFKNATYPRCRPVGSPPR
jgi:hypothetical protein